MADCTWTTLTGAKSASGSIKRWVNYDEIDPEDIIAEAENWLEQTLRVHRMGKRVPLTLSEGYSSIDLATNVPDFLDPIELFLDGYGVIDNISEDDLNRRRAADSDGALVETQPDYFTVIGDTMYFDAEADQDYTFWLTYYASPPALSATQPTNIYTERYRSLFKYVCMAMAYDAMKDEVRCADRLKKADIFISRLEVSDELSRRGQVYMNEVA